MQTIKVSEAQGPVLDWLVAKCEGHEIDSLLGGAVWYWLKCSLTGALEVVEVFKPSTDWSQGGPIIEREHIALDYFHDDGWLAVITREAPSGIEQVGSFGSTPLIAAMRCYCCSKLGDIVDVPEELCQQQSS